MARKSGPLTGSPDVAVFGKENSSKMKNGLKKESASIQEQLPGFAGMLSEYQEGKDELNLAEFPIATLSNRVDQATKTIVFEDSTKDSSTGEIILRSLTVTASDAFGLPTASDDEVLLGLIQLTRQQGFRSPKIYFTPYQLLQVLRWPPSTKNYYRVHEALNRWLGVSLYYDNAWRDKGTGQWVNQKFHFLDNVWIFRPGQPQIEGPAGYSHIKWNEVIFRSFQSGNIKALDFQVWSALSTAIAKRMYRFLDKRFYHRSRLSFNLEKFAFHKLGLPRSYGDMAQVKRRLIPAVEELEKAGFLKRLPASERFTKRLGIWEVHFERGRKAEDQELQDGAQTPLTIEVEDLTPTEGRLVGHGVTRAQAKRLAAEFQETEINEQVDALEYLLSKGQTMPENRAGWLVKAIAERYTPPRGFRPKKQMEMDFKAKEEKVKAREETKKKKESKRKAELDAEKAAQEMETKKVADYLGSLLETERWEVEMAALKSSPLTRGRLGSGQTGALLRDTIIHSYVLGLITEGKSV
ncbi:MAG: replication initiator protein A [Chitinophagaceae bacterium]|nr:MAG: replication initiator protein A [Chitinophagaceae bacterium]